jgi:hypothetical protein
MKPLQAWLPAFDPAVAEEELWRDLRRAQDLWRGEATVWLLPWLREEVRWTLKERPWISEVAIPSESLNRIDIFHFGANGYLHGNDWFKRFPEPQIGPLLDDWLNLLDGTEARGLKQYLVPEGFEFMVPRFEAAEVSYAPLRLQFEPAGAIPITNVSLDDRRIETHWPPIGRPLPTISPEAESRTLTGPIRRRTFLGELPIFESNRDSRTGCLMTELEWPEPFNLLFSPSGGGTDALLCQARSRKVAASSSTDRVAALRQAETQGSRFVCNGLATTRDIWLHPTLNETGFAKALWEIEGTLGLSFSTIDEACCSPIFQQRIHELVPVRRAIGIQGLFWSLLIERLTDGLSFRGCQRCGRMIASKKGKIYCARTDSPECFRRRRAFDRLRERERQGIRPDLRGN